MLKKYVAILLIVLVTISLYACSNPNNSTDGEISDGTGNSIVNENENENKDNENENQVIDPQPNTNEVEVTLYFVNKEYVETGDENLEKLIPEKKTVVVGSITLEEAIVKELMKSPATENLSTAIPSNVNLLGVEVADGTAFVNFSQEGLYGSSMQEDLTIAQIVNTLLELDHIDKVQFLIDGKKAESLMGHILISEPFEKPLYSK